MGKEDYSGVLATNRYEVTNVLGQGTWGTVYRARDKVSGDFVALKVLTPTELAQRQMVERGQTPKSVLLKEGGRHSCARIVHRTLDVDENGTYFLVMPVMKRFLDDVLNDESSAELRTRLDRGLSFEQILGYSRDLFDGLREMHNIRRDVHADIKPENLALDEDDRLYLNDLGTSTCASLKANFVNSKRGERGFELTRAPECFLGKNPSRKSDVWGAAALVYRMISSDGQYPLERELGNAVDKGDYLKQLGATRLRELLKKKVRQNIPKEHHRIGKILERCLDPEPFERPDSSALTSLIDCATGKNRFWKDAWNFTKSFGVVTGAIAAISAGAYFVATAPRPAPSEPPKVSGLLYLEDNSGKIFDIEEFFELPEISEGVGFATDKISKRVTTLPSIAYLVDCKAKAILSGGLWGVEGITSREKELFDENAFDEQKKKLEDGRHKPNGISEMYLIPAVALEATMNSIRDSHGRVDLEDLLVYSRVSSSERNYIEMIKGMSGSREFKDYKKVLPERERKFIETWLAYVHDGLARKDLVGEVKDHR